MIVFYLHKQSVHVFAPEFDRQLLIFFVHVQYRFEMFRCDLVEKVDRCRHKNRIGDGKFSMIKKREHNADLFKI